MVKVISLKLTAKEERIVNLLNKEGITNSDLIRTALWKYFKTDDQSKKPTEKNLVNNKENSPINYSSPTIILNLSENDEIKLKEKKSETILIYDYINFLKNEIDKLSEQNNKIQKQISKDIQDLNENEYSKQNNNHLNEQLPIFEQIKSSSNINYEIDDFLKKIDVIKNDKINNSSSEEKIDEKPYFKVGNLPQRNGQDISDALLLQNKILKKPININQKENINNVDINKNLLENYNLDSTKKILKNKIEQKIKNDNSSDKTKNYKNIFGEAKEKKSFFKKINKNYN